MNSYKQITELVLKVKELEASDNFKQQLKTDEMKDVKKIWTSWKNLAIKTEVVLNEINIPDNEDNDADDEHEDVHDSDEDKKPSADDKKPSAKKITKKVTKKASQKSTKKVEATTRIEEDEEPRKPRGFMIPKKITKGVAELLELSDNAELNQPELCKHIINYYKKNTTDNDSKMLKLDNTLKDILHVEDDVDEINQKELRKYIKNCYA